MEIFKFFHLRYIRPVSLCSLEHFLINVDFVLKLFDFILIGFGEINSCWKIVLSSDNDLGQISAFGCLQLKKNKLSLILFLFFFTTVNNCNKKWKINLKFWNLTHTFVRSFQFFLHSFLNLNLVFDCEFQRISQWSEKIMKIEKEIVRKLVFTFPKFSLWCDSNHRIHGTSLLWLCTSCLPQLDLKILRFRRDYEELKKN